MADEYDPGRYGDLWASIYDERHGDMDPTEAVNFLEAEAGGGPALELGIGTGRIALPLAARGVEVHGVDASEAMVAKLRAKPGGEAIPVTIGDFSELAVEGTYPLIFVAFNTIFALPSQEAQVRCFERVAAHLEPGGRFVVRGFVPDLKRYDGGQSVRVESLTATGGSISAATLDLVEQRIVAQGIMFGTDGVRVLPVELRYAWPSELDLMARLAGMTLRDRYGGWDRSPFTGASASHVSIYTT